MKSLADEIDLTPLMELERVEPLATERLCLEDRLPSVGPGHSSGRSISGSVAAGMSCALLIGS